jgi:hypothetical protein
MASQLIRQLRKNVFFRRPEGIFLRRQQAGFALVAALIAAIIILGLGIMVIQLSTQDLRSGASVVGEKKALAAVDAGIHRLLSGYDPAAASSVVFNEWLSVDSANDPATQYSISTPAAGGGAPLPLPGYSMEAGQGWGMTRMASRISGRNSNYGTEVQVDIGMGYGPVPTGTLYR